MKKFYKSKTLWVNIIAVIAFAIQQFTGYVVDVEMQATLLAVINFIIRLITKEQLIK